MRNKMYFWALENMNQDKAIFMSKAFQKSPFGGLTSLRALPLGGRIDS
jgi:hypothetical protein